MSGLTNLGIYPDAIDNIYEICEDIIQDVRDFAEKLGYYDDADRLNFDFSEEVLYYLKDNIDVYNMTNSIIGGCLEITKTALEETQLCKNFGISFEGYTNGGDSHLYFKCDGITAAYNGSGDMNGLLNEVLSHQLCDIICDRLLDSGECSSKDLSEEKVREMRKFIEQDLKNDEYDYGDVIACYNDWEITGTIRETVDSFLAIQIVSDRENEYNVTIGKNVKRKPSVERN